MILRGLIKMPYVTRSDGQDQRPVCLFEFRSHIELRQSHRVLLWLQMNHGPRKLHIFIHIHTISSQGRNDPCILKPECALPAGCHETCVCHPPTSVISRMLQFFQLFTSSIKDKSSTLLCVTNLLYSTAGKLMMICLCTENLYMRTVGESWMTVNNKPKCEK